MDTSRARRARVASIYLLICMIQYEFILFLYYIIVNLLPHGHIARATRARRIHISPDLYDSIWINIVSILYNNQLITTWTHRARDARVSHPYISWSVWINIVSILYNNYESTYSHMLCQSAMGCKNCISLANFAWRAHGCTLDPHAQHLDIWKPFPGLVGAFRGITGAVISK